MVYSVAIRERRNVDGRFTPEHTDDEILAAVRAHEPAGASEVADEVGMSRQGADRRLRRLRDAGRVSSKKVGASLVWFDTEVDESDQERDESASPSPVNHIDGSTAGPPSTPDTSTESDALADIVDNVATAEGWAENDTNDRLVARKAAARAALEHAAEHGVVSKQDAVEEIRPEHPVEGQDARTWYRQTIRPVLNEAAEYDSGAQAYWLADVGDE